MASSLFLLHRTVTLAGMMTSIFGRAVMHFTTTRPNAFMCSADRSDRVLEHEIALRHGQHLGGFACQKLAVRAHLIALRIDLDLGGRAVVDHALLGDAIAGVFHGIGLLA